LRRGTLRPNFLPSVAPKLRPWRVDGRLRQRRMLVPLKSNSASAVLTAGRRWDTHTERTRTGYQWGFSLLCINLAVAVAVLIQIGGQQVWRARELAHLIGYSLIYANLCGVLAVLLFVIATKQPALRRLPLAPLVAVAIIVGAAIGCLLAQTLLLGLDLATSAAFWSDFWCILRTAIGRASCRERV